jgi:hypothetical protein
MHGTLQHNTRPMCPMYAFWLCLHCTGTASGWRMLLQMRSGSQSSHACCLTRQAYNKVQTLQCRQLSAKPQRNKHSVSAPALPSYLTPQ